MYLKLKYIFFFVVGLCFISFSSKPVRILMAGDSTMADKVLTKTVMDSLTGTTTEVPFLERGWGQLLPEFINQKAIVKNYAKNGRSTRTFIEEGLWTDLLANTRKGDVVIIQFAHNDGAVTKTERYTNPAQFRLNFIAFVAEVKAKGATPILCTPVARRKFNEKGELVPTHGEYPEIIRAVAREQRVALVDMEKLTSGWLQKEGVEASKNFFHKFAPGESLLYPSGLDDNTHFNEAGARIVAGLFVKETQKLRIKSFSKLIKK